MKMYSLGCLDCLKAWFSSTKDRECPFCGGPKVYDTGKGDR